jgi:chaperonin GroEL (HSP60 family)
MDERVEGFLADVLVLAGEDPHEIREGVRMALIDCQEIFRAQEPNKRMKDKAAHACLAMCRAGVVEEMQRLKGTPTEEHLKLVLSIIDPAWY